MFWIMLLIVLVIIWTVHIYRLETDEEYREHNDRTSHPDKVNKKEMERILEEINSDGILFRSFNNSCSAILNKDNNELCVIYSTQQDEHGVHTYDQRLIKFSDILSSEVIIDSHTVTSTSRGSQLTSAAAGGALFGNTGAVIGGLSGKTKSTEQVKNMDIKLTVNDLENPVCKINFLDGCNQFNRPQKNGFKKDSEEYKQAIKQVEKWQGMFDVILKNQK